MRRRIVTTVLLLLCAFAAPLYAQDTEDAYSALRQEYTQSLREWRATLRRERDPEQRAQLREGHPARVFRTKFARLVEAGDGRALAWLFETAGERGNKEQARIERIAVFERLVADHASDYWVAEGLQDFYREAGRLDVETVARLTHELIESTKEPDNAASALFHLGQTYYGTRAKEYLDRSRECFERIVRDHPNTPWSSSARQKVEELTYLCIGCEARDFVGQTLSGKELRLSSLRGNVVVLDFYGFWCPPCRVDLPLLAALQEEFADQPFVIVGINTDKDLEYAREQNKRAGVTWESIHDGDAGGPLCRAWQIARFPYTYVLDRRGRVRARGLRAAELAPRIRELLAEK